MPAKKGQPSWNAGTSQGWTDKRGYRWIYVTENGRRRAKREHRDVMEKHLGRKLCPEELIHHVNGVKDDNRVENLSLEDWSKHTTEHHTGSTRNDLTKKAQQVLASYREEHKRLHEINAELLDALIGLIADYDEERYAIDCSPNTGCFECTAGTVPNNLNTGLCYVHKAIAAIAKAKGHMP